MKPMICISWNSINRKKTKQLNRYNKDLGDNDASREIVNTMFVNYNSSIFFKLCGEDGNFQG